MQKKFQTKNTVEKNLTTPQHVFLHFFLRLACQTLGPSKLPTKARRGGGEKIIGGDAKTSQQT